MSDGSERRQHERIQLNRPFRVRFGDARKLRNAYVRDISKGGLFLRTKHPRPKGAKVQVVLELPDGTRCPLAGEVVYSQEGERSGNGIQFTNLAGPNQVLLESYLEAHREADTAPEQAAAPAEAAPARAAAAPAPPPAPAPESPKADPMFELDTPAAQMPSSPVMPFPHLDAGSLDIDIDLALDLPDPKFLPREATVTPIDPEPAPEPAAKPAPPVPAPAPARKPAPAPAAAPAPAPAVNVAEFENLLELEAALTEIERHPMTSPYDVLGVEPTATEADVQEARAERLMEIDGGRYGGNLPWSVRFRITEATARVEGATTKLLDPSIRAAIDVDLNLVVPGSMDPMALMAFGNELGERREQAPPEVQSEYSLAEPYHAAGKHQLMRGKRKEAATLLRIALLYDPYNIDIRQKLARALGWG